MILENYVPEHLQEIASIGEKIIIVILILATTIIINKIVRRLFITAYSSKKQLMGVDKTSLNFLKNSITAVIYIVGISIAIYTIPSLRTLSVSLFAGAGILAVIVGFASQAAFSNIVSGIFISIFKPFRVGDRIQVQNIYGIVEDITLRHTVIKTYENIRYIIPNSRISEETIENRDIADEKINKFIEYGISYDSDIEKAMNIITEEISKHPRFIDNRSEEEIKEGEPAVNVKLISFGESSINLRARVWTKNSNDAFHLKCDTNLSVKKRFDKEGIEIPFPHRTLVYKTDVLKEREQILKKRKVAKKKTATKKKRVQKRTR